MSRGLDRTSRMKESAAITYPISIQRIKDIPTRQRPRELFERVGSENVPDEVLLALILRSGVRGMNVADLAHHLLARYGSLTSLAKASAGELARIRGVGQVKGQILKAAFELAHRLSEEKPESKMVRSPEEVAQILRDRACMERSEKFWILPLDTKHRLQRSPIEITKGLIDASLVHPREVFREAICASSVAIVLVHNHPSGDPSPSAEDIRITKQLVQAGLIVDIQVLDHVVLGKTSEETSRDYVSLRESGLVDFSFDRT